MSDQNRLIVIGLVHNNDPKRVRSQRSQAKSIQGALEDQGFGTVLLEVYKQEIKIFSSLSKLLLWPKILLLQLREEFEGMRSSRLRAGRNLSLSLGKKARTALRVSAHLAQPLQFEQALLRFQIQQALAIKHLMVWNATLEQEQVLGALVLEDDFFLRNPDSGERVAEILDQNAHKVDLIDLAGGLSRNELSLPSADGEDLIVGFFVANTTCAYFVNLRTCNLLSERAKVSPRELYFSPDFFISDLSKSDSTGLTLLPWDLPLVHGSREGRVESSIPY